VRRRAGAHAAGDPDARLMVGPLTGRSIGGPRRTPRPELLHAAGRPLRCGRRRHPHRPHVRAGRGAAAMRYVGEGLARGKVVVTPHG
jgi:hypothetical protein